MLTLGKGFTYSGTTQVDEGYLVLGSGDTTLTLGGDLAPRTIYLAANAELWFNVSAARVFPYISITGPGAQYGVYTYSNFKIQGGSLAGGGTWTATYADGAAAAPAYAAPYADSSIPTLNAGTLSLSDAPLSLSTYTNLMLDQGTVQVLTQSVTIYGTLGLAVALDSTLTLAGTVDGTAGLLAGGSGKVVLSGTNTFVGGVSIQAGSVEAQNGAAFGTGTLLIGTAGTAVLNIAEGGTLSNVIQGAGAVLKTGTSRLALGATASTYTGGTTISAGVLEVSAGTPLGSGAVQVAEAASLLVSVGAGSSITMTNALNGAGTLELNANGTLELKSVNSLTGGVNLVAGTLNISSAAALGAKLALGGGVLGLQSAVEIAIPVSVSGTVAVNAAAGTVSEITGVLTGSDASSIWSMGAGALKVRSVSVASGTFRVAYADGGSDGLTKNGNGTLLWTGVGTITGTAAVNGGTLQVAGDQILSGLTKTGGGILALSENAKFTGAKAVLQEGTLVVANNAALAGVGVLVVGGPQAAGSLDSKASVLDVSAIPGGLVLGAQTLMGRGQIKGAVTLAAGATLAPGNSIDNLSIEALTIQSGAKFEAEYQISNGVFTSDHLTITGAPGAGAINVGGTVVPTLYGKGRILDFAKHAMPLVSAAAGWNQRFDAVRSSAVLRGSLEYFDVTGTLIADPIHSTVLAGSVNMVLERVPFQRIGARGNRAEVGRGLDLALATTNTTLGALLDNLSNDATEAQVVAVLDQLNPKAFAEVYSLALSRLQDVQKTVSDRLNSLGAVSGSAAAGQGLGQAPGAESAWTAWTTAYATVRSHSANMDLGEGGSSNTSVGDVTGVERRFGILTLGLMGGVGTGSTQINLPGSTITSESWHLGLYMSAPLVGRVFADTLMFCGSGENVIKRTQHIPAVDALGNVSSVGLSSRTRLVNREWLVQLGVGAQLAPSESSWSIVPSVRFAYAGVSQEAATEKMGSLESLGIKTAAKTSGTVLMRSGLEIARQGLIGTTPVRATATAAWVHDFCVDPRLLAVRWQGAESAPWSISTEQRSADAVRFGAAVEIGLGNQRTLRFYGEQEYLNATKVFRGGVSFSVGF